MRAYHLTGNGIDGIERREGPEPTPGPGEVAVRVEATSLNFRDLLIAGRMGGDRIPLSDGAGRVIARGDGVDGVEVGDRVAGCFFPHWVDGRIDGAIHDAALGGTIDGMLAETVVLPAHGVVAIPAGWTSLHAATLPCAGLTAWNALVEGQQVRAGQTVVLLGTGGVSVFGLQFAKMLGARAIITSSSDEKLEQMVDLGADVTVNYRTTPDWGDAILEATGGQGADLILEVGGADTLAKSLACVRHGGQIALIGMVSGDTEVSPRPLFMRSATMRGIYVGNRRMFTEMVAAIDANGLTPLIDAVFDFDAAVDAYRHLRSQAHVGKVAIAV